MDSHLLVAFVLAVTLLSLVPGQDIMFIVANAATGGRRAGVVAALGMSTGLAAHTLAAALGLAALIQAAPAVLGGIRVGGAVLGFLAVSTWLRSRRVIPADPEAMAATMTGTGLRSRSIRRTYALVVLTNLANPKVILFYLAFFPQFIATGSGHWPVVTQFLLLGAAFIAIGLTVDASAGLLAGTLSERVMGRHVVRRWLERASAAVFGVLAVRLAVESR